MCDLYHDIPDIIIGFYANNDFNEELICGDPNMYWELPKRYQYMLCIGCHTRVSKYAGVAAFLLKKLPQFQYLKISYIRILSQNDYHISSNSHGQPDERFCKQTILLGKFLLHPLSLALTLIDQDRK